MQQAAFAFKALVHIRARRRAALHLQPALQKRPLFKPVYQFELQLSASCPPHLRVLLRRRSSNADPRFQEGRARSTSISSSSLSRRTPWMNSYIDLQEIRSRLKRRTDAHWRRALGFVCCPCACLGRRFRSAIAEPVATPCLAVFCEKKPPSFEALSDTGRGVWFTQCNGLACLHMLQSRLLATCSLLCPLAKQHDE